MNMITTDSFPFFSVKSMPEGKVKGNAEGKNWQSKREQGGSVENHT